MDGELLRRFLLGQLSEDAHAKLQEAFFDDPALTERVLSAEDELFDAYARGELSEEERLRFETRFGAQRQRIQFAKLLAKKRM